MKKVWRDALTRWSVSRINADGSEDDNYTGQLYSTEQSAAKDANRLSDWRIKKGLPERFAARSFELPAGYVWTEILTL